MLVGLFNLLLELLERHGLATVIGSLSDFLLTITPAHHLDPSLHDCLDQAEALADDHNGNDIVEYHKIAQNRNDLERAVE